MFNFIQSKNAADAANYYTNSLSVGDYYLTGEKAIGLWHGKTAHMVGLADGEEVTKQRFADLVEGKGITQRVKTDRRPGWDFTFSAPKSVSLIYGATGDERLRAAVQEAADATMRELEKRMEARVRKSGANHNRVTGNMLWASFLHTTARPTMDENKNILVDPQLHVHNFVINVTHDDVEDKLKAAQAEPMLKDSQHFETVFHSFLSSRVKAMGYPIIKRGKWWDIDIPRPLIERFSRRTQEVHAKARELGITDAKIIAELGRRTRMRTKDERPFDQLCRDWRDRHHPEELDLIDNMMDRATGSGRAKGNGARERTEFELDKTIEHHSTVDRIHLTTNVLRNNYGDIELGHVRNIIDNHNGLLHAEREGRSYITTPEVVAEEKALCKAVKDGLNTRAPLVRGDIQDIDPRLTAGQHSAVRHVLTSRDKAMVIVGGAGTGKTALSTEAIEHMKAEVARQAKDHKIVTFAPSHGAKQVLQKDGFEDANTVQRLIVDKDMQAQMAGGVMWVDEAGLLTNKDMTSLVRISNEQDARLILVGDPKQHKGVGRGEPLRMLIDHGGIKPAHVREIMRQSGDYKSAVNAAQHGDIKSAWKKLEAMGAVNIVEGQEKDLAIASDYLATRAAGRSVLVVAPTNAEKDKIVPLIRDGLREKNEILGEDHSVRRLTNTYLSKAEKQKADQYRPGQIIGLHQALPGVPKGAHLKVAAHDAQGNVIACDEEGNRHTLPLDRPDTFSVFRDERMTLAVGDDVRMTANCSDMNGARLTNGDCMQIIGFGDDGSLLMRSPKGREVIVDGDWGHLDYGYCSTSHASQGITVDRIIAALGTESEAAMNARQFYVTISRGKGEDALNIVVYTNNLEFVIEATSRSGEEMTTFDLEFKTRKTDPENTEQLRQFEYTARDTERRKQFFRDDIERTEGKTDRALDAAVMTAMQDKDQVISNDDKR